jgi:hypothetical protein
VDKVEHALFYRLFAPLYEVDSFIDLAIADPTRQLTDFGDLLFNHALDLGLVHHFHVAYQTFRGVLESPGSVVLCGKQDGK